MWWWLAGCFQGSSETNELVPTSERPVPPAAPETSAVETGFVVASRLNLRSEPRADATARDILAINTQVRLGERRGDFVAVITPDGRSGWVGTAFVADAPLTMEAIDRAIAAGDDVLTWRQRAAALRPTDPEVLGALAEVYQAAGRTEEAEAIRHRLGAGGRDGLAGWFPEHHAGFAAIDAELSAVRTAADLFALWDRSRRMLREVEEPLVAKCEVVDGFVLTLSESDEAFLAEQIPWAAIKWHAEGAAVSLELRSARFVAAARSTPGDLDDRFFALVTAAYDNAGGHGLPRWHEPDGDYTGCSTFGTGTLHFDLLEQVEALNGEAVPSLAGSIGRALVDDIVGKTDDRFPYCHEGQQTPTDALIAATEAILGEVTLTPEDRAALQQRIKERFGRS